MSRFEIVKCDCKECCIQKSGTSKNPERRFWGCYYYDPVSRRGRCNFFRWYDVGITDWQRNVTNRLIAEKETLKLKVRQLEMEMKSLNGELEGVKSDNGRLKGKANAYSAEVCEEKAEGNGDENEGPFLSSLWVSYCDLVDDDYVMKCKANG